MTLLHQSGRIEVNDDGRELSRRALLNVKVDEGIELEMSDEADTTVEPFFSLQGNKQYDPSKRTVAEISLTWRRGYKGGCDPGDVIFPNEKWLFASLYGKETVPHSARVE